MAYAPPPAITQVSRLSNGRLRLITHVAHDPRQHARYHKAIIGIRLWFEKINFASNRKGTAIAFPELAARERAMRLIASGIICAASLYWVDLTYFNGTHFNGLYAIISQLVMHY
jgi:hypothetical protein